MRVIHIDNGQSVTKVSTTIVRDLYIDMIMYGFPYMWIIELSAQQQTCYMYILRKTSKCYS